LDEARHALGLVRREIIRKLQGKHQFGTQPNGCACMPEGTAEAGGYFNGLADRLCAKGPNTTRHRRRCYPYSGKPSPAA